MTSLINLMFKESTSSGGGFFVFATTNTTIHYLATKAPGVQAAFRYIQLPLYLLVIAPVNRVVPEIVAASKFADFGDAVLHETAGHVGQNILHSEIFTILPLQNRLFLSKKLSLMVYNY